MLVRKLVEQLEDEREGFSFFGVLVRPWLRSRGQASQLGDVVPSARRSPSMIGRDSYGDSSEPGSQIRSTAELVAPPVQHQEDLVGGVFGVSGVHSEPEQQPPHEVDVSVIGSSNVDAHQRHPSVS